MLKQFSATELLKQLQQLGFMQKGDGKYISVSGSGVGQRTLYQPTLEEVIEFAEELVRAKHQGCTRVDVTVSSTELKRYKVSVSVMLDQDERQALCECRKSLSYTASSGNKLAALISVVLCLRSDA